MSSRFSNKYPIPEKFPEILHDFAREVVRYMPKDILDFSIQYFYSLEQNIPINYIEGGSKDIPKIVYALEQKEKYNRDNISTPSISTNQNTQNKFYKQNELSNKKAEPEINAIKETNSSKINSPIGTEESKHESNFTNGSGVVGISKKFVANIFENNQQKIKNNLTLEINNDNTVIKNNNNENKGFNKSGTTFSNISGNSSTKNGVKKFVGDVINVSKQNAIENEKK